MPPETNNKQNNTTNVNLQAERSTLQIFFDFAKKNIENNLRNNYFPNADSNFELITKNNCIEYYDKQGIYNDNTTDKSISSCFLDDLDRNGLNDPGGLNFSSLPTFRDVQYFDSLPKQDELKSGVVYVYGKPSQFSYKDLQGKLVTKEVSLLKNEGFDISGINKKNIEELKKHIEKEPPANSQKDEFIQELRNYAADLGKLRKIFAYNLLLGKNLTLSDAGDNEKKNFLDAATKRMGEALQNPLFTKYIITSFSQRFSKEVATQSENFNLVPVPSLHTIGSTVLMQLAAKSTTYTIADTNANTRFELAEDKKSVTVTNTTYNTVNKRSNVIMPENIPVKIEIKFQLKLTGQKDKPIETSLQDVKISTFTKKELIEEGLPSPYQNDFITETSEVDNCALDFLVNLNLADEKQTKKIFETLLKEQGYDVAVLFLEKLKTCALTLTVSHKGSYSSEEEKKLNSQKQGTIFSAIYSLEESLSNKLLEEAKKRLLPPNKEITVSQEKHNGIVLTTIDLLKNNSQQLDKPFKEKIIHHSLLKMGMKENDLYNTNKVFDAIDKYTVIKKNEKNEWKEENLSGENKGVLLKEYFSCIAQNSPLLESINKNLELQRELELKREANRLCLFRSMEATPTIENSLFENRLVPIYILTNESRLYCYSPRQDNAKGDIKEIPYDTTVNASKFAPGPLQDNQDLPKLSFVSS